MKNKRFFSFACVFFAVILAFTFALCVQAENGTDTGAASNGKYKVVFVHENKEYPMTEEQTGAYSYMTDTLSGETLYRVEIKKDAEVLASYLIYKGSEGKLNFSYNESTAKADVMRGQSDICAENFDFAAKPYYVNVEGGHITNPSGEFADCKLSSFYFSENTAVTVSASLEDDQHVTAWENNIGENFGTSSIIAVSAKGSEYNIKVKAVVDYLPIDELLKKSQSITLKKDYTISETIKLTSGEYTINLGGFTVNSASEDGTFDINGAIVTLEGGGAIKNTTDKKGAILLKGGILSINGVTVLGNYCAVSAEGGELVVNDGNLSGKNYALSFTNGSSCEAILNAGNYGKHYIGTGVNVRAALSLLGGKITVNGGSYYGKVIESWGTTPDIKIHAGFFESDITAYVAEGSSSEKGSGGYTVTVDPIRYTVSVTDGYGEGSYEAGETVTLEAFADDLTKIFEGWTVVEGGIVIDDLTARSISFVMPECNVVIIANFKVIEDTSGGEDTDTDTTPADTLPPVTTDDVTDKDTTPVTKPADVDSQNTELIGGAVTTGRDKKDDKSGGSLAIIILIVILVALLIAAIAVAIILIVRNYRIEKEAAERAMLGNSLMDNLADQLSEFGLLTLTNEGAREAAATVADDKQKQDKAASDEKNEETEKPEIDRAGADIASAAETIKLQELRRPKRSAQRRIQKADDAVTREAKIDADIDDLLK